MDLIKLRVPGYDFSVEKYKEAFLYYQENYANRYGVTLVQDCMHSDNARQALKELARGGKADTEDKRRSSAGARQINGAAA